MKIKCSILCDDVRQEANGKSIIIGTYNDDVFVSSFPATLKLCVAIVASFQAAGNEKIGVETSLAGSILLTGEMDVLVRKEGQSIITVPLPPTTFAHPGKFKVRARLSSGRWQEIVSANVVMPPSSITVVSSPSE